MMACAHHFDLPSPDGPSCIGVCRYCGEEREHMNGPDIETSQWLRRQRMGSRSGHVNRRERVAHEMPRSEP